MPPKSSEPLLVAFGSAVGEVRRRSGLSQEALAQGAGLQRTYVNEVERGRRNPTLITVARLAEALGISVAELAIASEQHLAAANTEPT